MNKFKPGILAGINEKQQSQEEFTLIMIIVIIPQNFSSLSSFGP